MPVTALQLDGCLGRDGARPPTISLPACGSNPVGGPTAPVCGACHPANQRGAPPLSTPRAVPRALANVTKDVDNLTARRSSWHNVGMGELPMKASLRPSGSVAFDAIIGTLRDAQHAIVSAMTEALGTMLAVVHGLLKDCDKLHNLARQTVHHEGRRGPEGLQPSVTERCQHVEQPQPPLNRNAAQVEPREEWLRQHLGGASGLRGTIHSLYGVATFATLRPNGTDLAPQPEPIRGSVQNSREASTRDRWRGHLSACSKLTDEDHNG